MIIITSITIKYRFNNIFFKSMNFDILQFLIKKVLFLLMLRKKKSYIGIVHKIKVTYFLDQNLKCAKAYILI